MIKLRLTWLYKDTKNIYIYIITKRVSSEDTSSLSSSLFPTQCGVAKGRCWNEGKIDLNNRRNTTKSMCGNWDINDPFPGESDHFSYLKPNMGFEIE